MKKVHYLEETEILKEANSLMNNEKNSKHTNPIKASLNNFMKLKSKSIKKDFL